MKHSNQVLFHFISPVCYIYTFLILIFIICLLSKLSLIFLLNFFRNICFLFHFYQLIKLFLFFFFKFDYKSFHKINVVNCLWIIRLEITKVFLVLIYEFQLIFRFLYSFLFLLFAYHEFLSYIIPINNQILLFLFETAQKLDLYYLLFLTM